MNVAYRETRFRVPSKVVRWPGQFVILTGYATTGGYWPQSRNDLADAGLRVALALESPWMVRVTGYHPGTGHAEPGWAAEIPLERARELGREFLQDAIFHVVGDVLAVVKCTKPGAPVKIGSFRQRLDSMDSPGSDLTR